MSWAANRQTKREEDKAYSLLGIFDTYMPLIYGEGAKNAFRRLREEIDKHSKGGAQNFKGQALNLSLISYIAIKANANNGLVLERLPSAADAPFNSYNRQNEPSCHRDTRVELLQEIYNWVDRQDEQCIFWLNSLAGTGKSTIARTVARRYFDQKRLGASFFFSRGGGDISHTGKFFISFAVQLARNVLQIQQFISDAITEQNNIAN
jgi:hypothetical protein